MKTGRGAVTLLLAAIALFAGSTAKATDVNLTAGNWTDNPGSQPDIPLSNDANGGLYFDFQVESGETKTQWGPIPVCAHFGNCYSMNYLTTANLPTHDISGYQYLVVRVKAARSSNALFRNETAKFGTGNGECGTTIFDQDGQGNYTHRAKISLLLNTFGSGNNHPRFWAEPPVEMPALDSTTGSKTIIVPLDPHYWNDVNGVVADTNGNPNDELEAQFHGVLTDLQTIGMTFGGACSDGHGVYITPSEGNATANFTVERYELLPQCPAVNTCASGSPQFNFDDPTCAPGTDTTLQGCATATSFLSCPAGQHVFRRTCPCSTTGTWSAEYCAAY